MEKEAVRERLYNLIARLNQRGDLTRSDLDEMVMLVTACEDVLPERLAHLIKNTDHSGVPPTDRAKLTFLDRAVRIINVAETLPPPTAEIALDDELIPTFVLPEEDKLKVLNLCQQMRKIIFSSDVFDVAHKRRLLNRVSAIEQQVHQPKGMFDIVRGGMSDLGETLGRFGTDIKPLTDRMAEVVGIVRKSTGQYDQLPAPEEVKQLPPPDIRPTESA